MYRYRYSSRAYKIGHDRALSKRPPRALVNAATWWLSRHPKILQRDPREAKAGLSKLPLDALHLLLPDRERGCLGGGSTRASRAGHVSFDGAGTVDTMLEP